MARIAGSVIARSSSGQISNITIYVKSAVGKNPVDMRSGVLVISYRDPYNFIPTSTQPTPQAFP